MRCKYIYVVQWLAQANNNLEEHPAAITARITLGSVLHRIIRLCGDIGYRAAMSEEQNLDRDGQAGVQSDDNDEQNARGLRVDR